MLKSLLIGLDGSEASDSVIELGVRWGERLGTLAVGIAIVDEPGILTSKAVLFAGGGHRRSAAATPLLTRSRRRDERILRHFAERCNERHVAWRTLEDAGTPFVQILMEAQCYDVILLGQQTHFDYGKQAEPDQTLEKVLEESPRPVVVVPNSVAEGTAVVVAYDGSLQSARALYAFEASGLGIGCKVHIVTVDCGYDQAARHASRAVEFLHLHGIEAVPHPVATSSAPADVILRKVHHLEAGLLVIGTFGQPVLREFILGSATRTVLRECPVPVFCYH